MQLINMKEEKDHIIDNIIKSNYHVECLPKKESHNCQVNISIFKDDIIKQLAYIDMSLEDMFNVYLFENVYPPIYEIINKYLFEPYNIETTTLIVDDINKFISSNNILDNIVEFLSNQYNL